MSRLNVALLWHMHQPCYRVPDNRAFRLPWARLHALKDYADMPRLAAALPGVRTTFNLVPALLDQLAAYADGASDVHLDLTRLPADGLTEAQRCLVLRDFFMANWRTMIEPRPRYRELLLKRGFNFRDADLPAIARRFTAADILDLQVWFNLCWTDPAHIAERPVLRELAERGRGYRESDKAALLEQQAAIVRSVIPAYREAQQAGLIEVSTSPYYHPILPLLCDSDEARRCMPDAPLPERFSYPDDARAQIVRGLDRVEQLMGRRPSGLWPSEGSVSERTVALLAEAGVAWLATDDAILQHSLGGGVRPDESRRYRPYRLGGAGQPAIFFRDHQLSDLIGFTYAEWEPGAAARDLVGRLEAAAGRLGADAGRHVVPIILDGENCWEFYRNDGNDFLQQLYQGLAASATLSTCTFSEYLAAGHGEGQLSRLYPGSWINGDFGIWIGRDEDNRAWTLLLAARREVERREAALDPAVRAEVYEELYAAEGSDWCWWYGGNFSSENLEDFDFLFRAHLQKVYRLMGLDVPQALFHPVAQTSPVEQLVQEPFDLIAPAIDGRLTSFYEWTGAGVYNVWNEGGTMHRSQSLLRSVLFGFDHERLYLRLDGSDHLLDPAKMPDLAVAVDIRAPRAAVITIPVNGQPQPDGTLAAYLDVIEIAVPFDLIAAGPGGRIEFFLSLKSGGAELERHPMRHPISLARPDKLFKARNWQA